MKTPRPAWLRTFQAKESTTGSGCAAGGNSGPAGKAAQRFKLGSGLSDEQRRNPPPVGSTVTYRFRGLNDSGIPRFASFMRVAKTRRPRVTLKKAGAMHRLFLSPWPVGGCAAAYFLTQSA
jgi:hypothetical protein